MKKFSAVSAYDLSDKQLENYLNDGYELKHCVAEIQSFYNATQFITKTLFVLIKEYEE